MAQISLSVRPWSFNAHEQPSVIDLLNRVNNERGHFRNIIDASLQEELAAEGALQLSESDEEEEEEEELLDNEISITRPSTREELYHAKFEMLQKVSLAHNEIMMALDFISLLESKDSAAGKQTMSQYLKDNIQPGTLGVDIWQRMPQDTIREAQESRLAYNIRVDAIQKSADSLLSAAKTLENNVRKETTYWNQILSVTDEGWSVCRLPGQRHKLAVRFGMSESSPEFSRNGIAGLSASEDGTVSLDRDVQTRLKSVQVVISKEDEILGRSKVYRQDDSGSIKSLIKQARDALFDEELYRELAREGRSLAASGIRISNQAVSFPFGHEGDAMTVSFELVHHNETAFDNETTNPHHCLAQSLLCTARLLLCQAHREQLTQRSKIPAPMKDVKSERPLLRLLRPLLAITQLLRSVSQVNTYLERLSDILQHASVKCSIKLAARDSMISSNVNDTEHLLSSLLQPVPVSASIQFEDPDSTTRSEIAITMSAIIDTSYNIVYELHSNDQTLRLRNVVQVLEETNKRVCIGLARQMAICSKGNWQLQDEDTPQLVRQKDDGVIEVLGISIEGKEHEMCLTMNTRASTQLWQSSQTAEHSLWSACLPAS